MRQNLLKNAIMIHFQKELLSQVSTKSSRLFTTSGISITGAVLEMAKRNKMNETWFYNPIAKSLSPTHATELYILKLHPNIRQVLD